MKIWRKRMTQWPNQSISYEAVNRTAPATPALVPKPSDYRILSECGSLPPKRYESIQFQSSFPKRSLNHGHRPLPHSRETLVEGEAGDLIPSLPFAEAGFRKEDARGTRIVLPWGVEQGMKEVNSFDPCSVIMGWLGDYQGVSIPRSNSMDIKLEL